MSLISADGTSRPNPMGHQRYKDPRYVKHNRKWEIGHECSGVRLLKRWYNTTWSVQCLRCRRVYVARNPFVRLRHMATGCHRCYPKKPKLCQWCGESNKAKFGRRVTTCMRCETRRRRGRRTQGRSDEVAVRPHAHEG